MLVSGSIDPSTGLRGGVSSAIRVEHAHRLVENGFAILRYDPLGVGGSTGAPGFESLEARADDILQPTAKRVALDREYLVRAGNADLTIVVFPHNGHSIEGYWPS